MTNHTIKPLPLTAAIMVFAISLLVRAETPAETVSVDLSLRLTPGLTAHYRSTMDANSVSTPDADTQHQFLQHTVLDYELACTAVDSAGLMTLRQTLTHFTVKGTSTGPSEHNTAWDYDSDTPMTQPPSAAVSHLPYLNKSVFFDIDANATVHDVRGLAPIAAAMFPTDPNQKPALASIRDYLREEFLKSRSQRRPIGIPQYPASPLSLGASWRTTRHGSVTTPGTIETTYTVTGQTDDSIHLTITRTPITQDVPMPRQALLPSISSMTQSISGNFTGAQQVDRTTGLIRSAQLGGLAQVKMVTERAVSPDDTDDNIAVTESAGYNRHELELLRLLTPSSDSPQ